VMSATFSHSRPTRARSTVGMGCPSHCINRSRRVASLASTLTETPLRERAGNATGHARPIALQRPEFPVRLTPLFACALGMCAASVHLNTRRAHDQILDAHVGEIRLDPEPVPSRLVTLPRRTDKCSDGLYIYRFPALICAAQALG
jgi:hypothetical protein